MFCPFSAPIGLGSFELLSLRRSRRIPALAPWAPMSGYTLYVSRRAVVTGIGGKRKHIVDAPLCDAVDPVPTFLQQLRKSLEFSQHLLARGKGP
ncbi:hypothetical protein TNCV_109281 [Trichonephila clavipes]|nr:hypothetical protein TNCV_109281 [Trichonephila clavipes]